MSADKSGVGSTELRSSDNGGDVRDAGGGGGGSECGGDVDGSAGSDHGDGGIDSDGDNRVKLRERVMVVRLVVVRCTRVSRAHHR